MTTAATPRPIPPGHRADADGTASAQQVDPITERLLHQRILLLDRELEQDNGAALCSRLLLLAADDPARDITILINSPGGLVPAMFAIADLMDTLPCDVRTVALGMAYSAGQFLLTHGTPGKRFILPHGKVLMHQGSAGFSGSAVDIELQAEDLRKNRDLMIRLTSQRTGQSVERIAQDSERDRTWDAAEAIDYGFCDHLVHDLDQVLPFGLRRAPGTPPTVSPGFSADAQGGAR